MADNAARQPNLNLTAEEKRLFYQYFQAADKTNLGVITGEIAVPFFEKTKLLPETLGLIWQIADKENRGLLTPSGFGIVMRLIGHAQAGRNPTDELALQPGPLPKFDGSPVELPPESANTGTGTTSPPPSTPGAPIRVPPLNPDDVNKFTSLFEKSDIRGGVMSGEAAKAIFERARLPNEILGRIWNLTDTKQRGALDATEFIIAMHFLTSYKSGAMRGIPQTLPGGLYEAAARKGTPRSSIGSRQGPDAPPVPFIPTQFSGPQRTESPINRQFGSPLSAQATGGEWLVTPLDKSHFDSIFATVDTAKAGMVNGDQAVSFFMNAQLPEETLAQIWDLADIDADGQLTKDEFAVAMYLVRQQRSGKEPLPQTLPPALIPPSMRRQAPGQAPAPAPAQIPPPSASPAAARAPSPRSAADDLFGLDTFSAPPAAAAPAQAPQSTGSSNRAFQSGQPSAPPSPSTTFKPFVPTSSFGQSIQPQVAGASAGASPAPSHTKSPPPSDDLLGDNDPEESKKLTNETTELANLSNQVGSLANEMQSVQGKRTSAEQNLSQTSQQKRDFESRLAQARSMYEQEVKNFKALEEQLNTSRSETTKLQQEYALIDGSRQDLQNQYEQVSAALTADQQENASLKEKIREANAVVAQLKPALEKARSDARQQKGLVAINKKQLGTVEGESTKIQEEMDSLSKEQPEEEAAPEGREAIASPALSTASQSTNPFFKRTVTGSSDNAPSPQMSGDQQRSFESVFGPSFASPSTATPPPPTSFRSQSPAAHQQPAPKSPATSGAPTPSVSPPPSNAGLEPPPATQGRQFTPSALPFGDVHSASSSTKVSPPGSRFGASETPTLGTPSQAGAAQREPSQQDVALPSGQAPVQSPFDEVQESSARFPEVPTVSTESSEKVATPTGETKQSREESFDELFGGPAHQRSQSQKANDFEEAFAAMKPAQGDDKTNGTAHAAGGEFPPIRELDNDGDSTSTDTEAPMGFDDNFTSAAPTSIHTQPPVEDAQQSPPNYNESVPDKNEDAPEYTGLLPGRSDPTHSPDAPHSVEHNTGAPIVAGEPQHETSNEKSGAKSGKPDFEAAFAGMNLAPAKEAEDDEDEDTTPDNKNPGDFDFSFDTPSQRTPAANTDSKPSGSSSDFFAFDSTVSPAATPTQNKSPAPTPTSQHDWDSLFAPLDKPTAVNGSKRAKSAADADADADETDTKHPGWALGSETGEDDQILQRLTGMGFARDDSLSALEKFDYNLDKAADFLTSKS